MNKVILIGRLTGDLSVREAGEHLIASGNIAVDRRGKKDEADFLKLNFWDKQAETAEAFLSKGTKIAVEGSIVTGSYEKDGVKHYTTEINVASWEFAESKKDVQEQTKEAAKTGGYKRGK